MSPVRKSPPADDEVRVVCTQRDVEDPARLERVLAILQRILDTTPTPDENGQR